MAKTKTVAVSASEARPDPEAAQLPAVLDPAFAGGDVVVKIKKHVTIPVLKWPVNTSIIFMAVDAIREGKELKNVVAGKPKMEPANLMTIASPAGELRTLIINEVFGTELENNYPKETYIDKWFQAHKFAPDEGKGKRYATFSIQEIEKPI